MLSHISSSESYSCVDELNAQEWENLKNVGNATSVAIIFGDILIKMVGDKRAIKLSSPTLDTLDQPYDYKATRTLRYKQFQSNLI